MIDWVVRQTICGLDELGSHGDAGVTHLLSILDPATPEPPLGGFTQPLQRLVLRFHDAVVERENETPPTRAHVETLLAFGRTLPGADPAHLLVHCHMGISRSVAAAAALLAQAHPEANEDLLFEHIRSIRPKAWPNLLITEHADVLLGRGGRMVEAAARLYRRQLDAFPRIGVLMRDLGRARELELAGAA